MDLATLGIKKEDQVKPEILCNALNKELAAITPPQVQLVAIRWTVKGNLVITGGPTATPHTLQLAAPHISTSLFNSLNPSFDSHLPQPRPNTKWSKICINGVPMGMLANGSPLPPDECHRALTASNPSYASLSIMPKPSWVHPPTSYKPGSVSSLSVAFEDPDGSKLKMLLAERYLYAFGNRASVRKWKYHQNNPKDKSKSTTSKHSNVGDSDDDEDVDQLLSNVPTSVTPHSFESTSSLPPWQQHIHRPQQPRPPSPFPPEALNPRLKARNDTWRTSACASASPQDHAHPHVPISPLVCQRQAHFPHSQC